MNKFLWIASFALAAGIMLLDYVSSFVLLIVGMGSDAPGSSSLPFYLTWFLSGAIYGLAVLWFSRWLVKEIHRRSAEVELDE